MTKPSRSSYFPLPQHASEADNHDHTDGDEGEEEGDSISHPPRPSSSFSSGVPGPMTTAKHLDEQFRRWVVAVGKKIRLKKAKNKGIGDEGRKDEEKDILASVFEVWEAEEKGEGVAEEDWRTLDHQEPMTKDSFNELVPPILSAITSNVQPRLNSKGSSGSYFAKDATGRTVGIFKPKDEEPYGRLNPKFFKFVHREFLSKVIPFGRACLIPAQSYLSEAAASLLDRRLKANIVPRTEIVGLSSPSFFYDWIDRERAKIRGTWREKMGSLQVFLTGYTDASVFLRNHPYPGRPLSQTLDTSPHRAKRINLFSPFQCLCGRADAEGEDDDDEEAGGWGWGGEDGIAARDRERERGFRWTEEMMESFKVELEKWVMSLESRKLLLMESMSRLVVLDFIMRNTDRGLDNMMIKPCSSPDCELGSDLMKTTSTAPPPRSPMSEVHRPQPLPSPSSPPETAQSSTPTPPPTFRPHVHVAAIDNSLSFPHQHPLGWRSYQYGWLYLPVTLIGQPFSQSTREHYLPLLSNPKWWSRTVWELKELFKEDEDFDEKMFRKQMAVMKGQGWNVVQSLLNEEDGPLELCRRQKKLIWDDFIEVADDEMTRTLIAAACSPPSQQTLVVEPIALSEGPHSPSSPTSKRSYITTTTAQPTPISLPVPLKRVSSDKSRRPKPTSRHSHSRLSQSISSTMEIGSLTGLDLMKHLDRVEAEERDSRRRSFGRNRVASDMGPTRLEDRDDEEEVGEEGDNEGPQWGVQSDGDLRRSAGMGGGNWRDRGGLSFDLDRSSGSAVGERSPVAGGGSKVGRNRSGSLTSLSRVPSGGRGGRRMQNQSTASGAGEEGGWLGDFQEEGENEEVERGNEAVRKKIVVVERMENVEEGGRFSGLC